MSYMHTYEFDCKCGNKMTAEMHNKLDNYPRCFSCDEVMTMNFYLRSPDTRAWK